MSLNRARRGLGWTAAGLLVLGVLNTPAAAAALPQLGPAASFPAPVCGPGETLIPMQSSSTESDGWIRLDYSIDGRPSFAEFPPDGFDAFTAPDAELSRHHFRLPGRPSDASQLQSWASQMSRLTWNRVRGICRSNSISASGRYYYGPNWGGDEYHGSGYYFTAVAAYFKQAAITSTCGSGSILGSWVGLGGTGSEDLLQAGTITNPYGSGLIKPFWEEVPFAPRAMFFGDTVKAGDTIWVESFVSGVNGYVYVIDTNTGKVDPWSLWVGSWNPTSAEYIDERPQVGGTATNPIWGELDNYGQTSWTGMQVLRSNASAWSGAYNEPNEVWDYIYSGPTSGFGGSPPPPASYGHRISRTSGSYSDNHMNDQWVACH
jgi:Peptidase A4 family